MHDGGALVPDALQEEKEWYRAQVEDIYAEKNPSKLSDVAGVLKKYEGMECLLYLKVCTKYAVDALPTLGLKGGERAQELTAYEGALMGSLILL